MKGYGTMIGRVHSAQPSDGERFYLRILLNHVTGCTSFQAIRTVPDENVCGTFKEAACHWGLLQDDSEYDLCLAMAASWHMPPQLSHLSVTILLYNEPCNPRHYRKSINVLFLMTFCIVLENLCPISKLMSTYSMLQ